MSVVVVYTIDEQLPCSVGVMRRDLVVMSPSKLLQHYQSPTVLSVDSLTKFVVLDVSYNQPTTSSSSSTSSGKKKAVDSITDGDEKSVVPGEISLAEIEVLRSCMYCTILYYSVTYYTTLLDVDLFNSAIHFHQYMYVYCLLFRWFASESWVNLTQP